MLQRTLHTNRGNANGEEFPSWNRRSSPLARLSQRQLRAARTRLLRRLRQNPVVAPPHSALLERFRADRMRAQQLQVWGAGEHVERLRVRAM